jgi:hypothetical protein
MMKTCDYVQICVVVITIGGSIGASLGQTPDGPKAGVHAAPDRDGQHDFDFLFGRWQVHCRRLLHPLTGSKQWVEFDGNNVVHRIWNGRATLDEFEADTPSGHLEGMTIRTYSTKSHQWSIYWSSQANGTIDFPPMVGEFINDRGTFYDSESYNGRAVFVRFLWTVRSPNSAHWEQAFSADGGKTWETNFIWDLAREKE